MNKFVIDINIPKGTKIADEAKAFVKERAMRIVVAECI